MHPRRNRTGCGPTHLWKRALPAWWCGWHSFLIMTKPFQMTPNSDDDEDDPFGTFLKTQEAPRREGKTPADRKCRIVLPIGNHHAVSGRKCHLSEKTLPHTWEVAASRCSQSCFTALKGSKDPGEVVHTPLTSGPHPVRRPRFCLFGCRHERAGIRRCRDTGLRQDVSPRPSGDGAGVQRSG